MDCPKCGISNTDNAVNCDCGWSFTNNTDGNTNIIAYAGMDSRLIAKVIDFTIIMSVLVIPSFTVDNSEFAHAVSLICVAVAAFYMFFNDAINGGQGFGKRFCKIAAVDIATRSPCTYLKSFIRNGASYLGLIDLAALLFNKKNQRLGDLLAKTVVIKKLK